MKNVVFTFVIILFLTSCNLFDSEEKKLNAGSWKNEPENRHEMVADLRDNYLYIGMPESEVITMLGEPNEITEFSEYHMGSGWDYTHILYIEYTDNLLSDHYDEQNYW